MIDVMRNMERIEEKVHEHGFVALVDVMPRLVPEGKTADYAIAQAARKSYGHGTKSVNDDRTLIRNLIRHKHTGPVEFGETKWHVKLPIFVARQMIRTRTASVDELSARYSVLPSEFYRPKVVRTQSQSNRQGSDGAVDTNTAHDFLDYLEQAEDLHIEYERLCRNGVTREQARIGLPVSIYTEFFFKIDLHNLFHFLKLRIAHDAQEEIRDYANAMLRIIEPIFPIAVEAFRDYELESMRLTRLEIEAIRTNSRIKTDNKREYQEWQVKRKMLGLPDPENPVNYPEEGVFGK